MANQLKKNMTNIMKAGFIIGFTGIVGFDRELGNEGEPDVKEHGK